MATAVTTRPSSSFWASVREALRGSHQDYTTGSLTRAIFLLAVPMVLEMLMESLFAIVDVFWVARLGAESVATVGLVEAMLTMVYAVGMGLGLSATAMVARRVGEKDREGAAVAGVQAITLGLLAGLCDGRSLPLFRAAPAAADGGVPGRACRGHKLCADRHGRLRRGVAPDSEQRGFSRRR